MYRLRIPFRMHRSGWIIPVLCAFIGIYICGLGWRLGLPAGLLMVGSLLLHEEGHMLAATALGVPVREIGLCMGGAYTRRAPACCRRDEVIISACAWYCRSCFCLGSGVRSHCATLYSASSISFRSLRAMDYTFCACLAQNTLGW